MSQSMIEGGVTTERLNTATEGSPLLLNLFGGFEAMLADHRLVKISTKKNQALLAYLALASGRPCPRAKLADLLWSDRDREHARDSLRQSLVALRRDLSGLDPMPLVIEGDALMLRPALVDVDVLTFARLAQSQNLDDLRRAAALYRGDLLEGLAARDQAFDQWLTEERTRLHDRAIDVLQRLAPQLSGAAALAVARQLVALDPLREGSNLALIRAYAGQGQTEMAVRQARDYRALLSHELQIPPSARVEAEIAEIIAGSARKSGPGPALPDPNNPIPALPQRKLEQGKVVIAVLPFENRSSGAESRFFADALTDNVITAISRAAMFRVVARSSAQTYVGQAGDFRKIALDLGADYVLEGGVQQAGERIRLSARLIDAAAGHHIWADRYECTPAELMDIQDTLARSVTASVETQIYLAKREARASFRPAEATARDLIMRCRGLLYDMSAESFDEVAELAQHAIALEPGNGSAHLILAEAHLHQLSMGLLEHNAASVARGVELAGRALGLAPQDEWAHSFMAKALSEAQRYDEAVGEAERALEINPSLSVAIARLGELHALLGRPEMAIEKCRLALKLNPRNPTNFWRHSSIALAHFLTGDHESMLQEARRVHSWRPDFLRGPILMAAALAALERPAEARQALTAAQALWPALDLEIVVPRFMPRFARDADHQRLLDLLRAAGLPERYVE